MSEQSRMQDYHDNNHDLAVRDNDDGLVVLVVSDGPGMSDGPGVLVDPVVSDDPGVQDDHDVQDNPRDGKTLYLTVGPVVPDDPNTDLSADDRRPYGRAGVRRRVG